MICCIFMLTEARFVHTVFFPSPEVVCGKLTPLGLLTLHYTTLPFFEILPPTRGGSPRSPRATSPSGASPPSPGPPRTGPFASSPRGTPTPLLQPPARAWTADPGPGMLRGGNRVRSEESQKWARLVGGVVRLDVKGKAVLL